MRIFGNLYTNYKYNQPSVDMLADSSIQLCNISLDVLDELV